MLEQAIKEIEDHLTLRVKVNKQTRDETLESRLFSKGFNMKIMWDFAFKEQGATGTKVPCVCLKDWHISYYYATHLNACKIRCEGCRLSLYKSKASANNSEYVSHRTIPNATLVTIKCLTDEYIRELTSSELLENNFRCDQCQISKYKDHAERSGFEFIKHKLNSSKRSVLLSCKECLHFRTTTTGDLAAGKLKCVMCNINKYSEYLKEKKCTYVEHNHKKGQVFVKYLNEFGVVFEVSSGNLFRKKFAITKETHWNQKHGVYCIKAEYEGNIYCKIGTANDPKQRVKDLKLTCKSEVSTIAMFEDRYKAKELESTLHRLLSDYRLQPEVVDQVVGKAIRRKNSNGLRYEVKDGATEWFNSEVLLKLKELGYNN